jgi:hypothetical protein
VKRLAVLLALAASVVGAALLADSYGEFASPPKHPWGDPDTIRHFRDHPYREPPVLRSGPAYGAETTPPTTP